MADPKRLIASVAHIELENYEKAKDEQAKAVAI